MASKSQQRAWLALFDDPQAYCPQGQQLKNWLFGGGAISTAHALFDVEANGLAIIADLFGDERYFADSDAFWTAQIAAIEKSEERRVGKECGRRCRSRGPPYYYTKQRTYFIITNFLQIYQT